MSKSLLRRMLVLSVAFATPLALAGCGIKGPLELPAEAQVQGGATGKGQVAESKRLSGYQPTSQERKSAKQLGAPVQPDQPFILDSLLN